MKHSKLIIKDISVLVHLGVTSKERKKTQKVKWTVHCLIKNNSHFNPASNLKKYKKPSKYICYELITKRIIEHSKSQIFFLVESMVSYCFYQLKKDFPQIKALRLCLHKVRPPVKSIESGVFYEYGDF